MRMCAEAALHALIQVSGSDFISPTVDAGISCYSQVCRKRLSLGATKNNRCREVVAYTKSVLLYNYKDGHE